MIHAKYFEHFTEDEKGYFGSLQQWQEEHPDYKILHTKLIEPKISSAFLRLLVVYEDKPL